MMGFLHGLHHRATTETKHTHMREALNASTGLAMHGALFSLSGGPPLYQDGGGKTGLGGWSTFCFRSGYYKEPNGNKKLTIPGLIRNLL